MDSNDTPQESHPFQPPAYVRKQVTQPKPLAGWAIGVPSTTNVKESNAYGIALALILLFIVGIGVAVAHFATTSPTSPTTLTSLSASSVATATTASSQTALGNLPTTTPAPTDTPTATATPIPLPTATPRPLPTATPRPPAPPPPPPTPCPGVNCNPWGYNFTPGNYIYSPPGNFCSYFNCIPSFWTHTNGYVEECSDGTYSHSGGVQGSCSYHGGNWRPLYSH